MPLIQDPALQAQAAQVPQTFESARQALAGEGGPRALEPAYPDRGPAPASAPAPPPLPAEVAAAQQAFIAAWEHEHGGRIALHIVQYFRFVNGERVEGWTDAAGPGPDAVQISQTIAVNSPQGAHVDIRQWIARAEPLP